MAALFFLWLGGCVPVAMQFWHDIAQERESYDLPREWLPVALFIAIWPVVSLSAAIDLWRGRR